MEADWPTRQQTYIADQHFLSTGGSYSRLIDNASQKANGLWSTLCRTALIWPLKLINYFTIDLARILVFFFRLEGRMDQLFR